MMELFKHIMSALVVGAVLAGLWLVGCTLVEFIAWIGTTFSLMWAIAAVMFFAGILIYLSEVSYV